MDGASVEPPAFGIIGRSLFSLSAGGFQKACKSKPLTRQKHLAIFWPRGDLCRLSSLVPSSLVVAVAPQQLHTQHRSLLCSAYGLGPNASCMCVCLGLLLQFERVVRGTAVAVLGHHQLAQCSRYLESSSCCDRYLESGSCCDSCWEDSSCSDRCLLRIPCGRCSLDICWWSQLHHACAHQLNHLEPEGLECARHLEYRELGLTPSGLSLPLFPWDSRLL